MKPFSLSDLQARLRAFAAERQWQPFHTPKNLAMALMVEAAELTEIFQWMTPEQSLAVRDDPALTEPIADEVADVLLYLLQLADHAGVDLAQAVFLLAAHYYENRVEGSGGDASMPFSVLVLIEAYRATRIGGGGL